MSCNVPASVRVDSLTSLNLTDRFSASLFSNAPTLNVSPQLQNVYLRWSFSPLVINKARKGLNCLIVSRTPHTQIYCCYVTPFQAFTPVKCFHKEPGMFFLKWLCNPEQFHRAVKIFMFHGVTHAGRRPTQIPLISLYQPLPAARLGPQTTLLFSHLTLHVCGVLGGKCSVSERSRHREHVFFPFTS